MPSPFLLGRIEIPTNFSKSQRLVGFQFLEGIATNEGVIFFRVVAVFTKSLQTKILSGFKSAQLISFTCHEHVASDHLIEINNLCTMIHNNLICVYFKFINITIKTYIQQLYASFHLWWSHIAVSWKQNNYTSVFIRRHIVFSAIFCSFIATFSSVFFIVQMSLYVFDFTTWHEHVRNRLIRTFLVAPTT